MHNNVSKSKKIAIISVLVDNFSLTKFTRNNKFDKLIIESKNQLKNKHKGNSKLIKFDWNENHTLTKLRVESTAFDILRKTKEIESIKKIKFILGNKASNKLVYRIIKRVNLDLYTEILKSIAIGNLYYKQGKNVTLVFNRNNKLSVVRAIDYLKSLSQLNKHDWSDIDKLTIKYTGNLLLDYFNDYLRTLGIGIYFLSTMRNLRINKKKNYKVGLLTWTYSKLVGKSNLNNEGLDAVIPENTPPREVLVYGKNLINPDNLKLIKYRGYHLSKFDLENIYKKFSPKDLIILINLIFKILTVFPFFALTINKAIRNKLAYIIYQYLKWNKFTDNYKLQLSVGYLEYSLGDLIRNSILMENGTSCFSYNHSISEGSYLNKDIEILDTWKAFVPFSKRFFILPNQVKKYKSSMVFFKKSFITGPLFTKNNSIFQMPIDISNRKIVSVFSSSLGTNSFNNNMAHKLFIESIFKFLEEYSDKITFLFCLKYKRELLNSKLEINTKKLKNYIAHKNIIFIDKSINTTDLIRSSNGVISMPFTTPTIEAIALKVPAIFFDSMGLFPNNYFSDLNGLYIDNYQLFKNFLEKVIFNDLELKEFVKKASNFVGITDKNDGIGIIKAEIKKLISQNN